MDADPLLLSRLQFAFTVAFHIVFPSFTIGLASYLAVLEGLWLSTRREVFRNLYLFWVKVFALAFGMGVVSGVVMSYEFGTNWSAFSAAVGNVLGPLLGFEVLTAFFLEASFLGIMLFGWRRVGPGLHFLATALVAFGTLVSAFWILSANSWMQTPAGFEQLPDGRFIATDWWQVIFNPSFASRFVHMVLAAYLTTGLVVLASAAWSVLRGRTTAEVRMMAQMAIGLIAILAPLQLVVGDVSGKVAFAYQPLKVAAIEAYWETGARQPSILFALPDAAQETNRAEIAIPEIGSWIVAGDANAVIKGLKEWPAADRPPVALVFWSFRIMVALGLLMIALGLWGAVLWATRRLSRPGLFHWIAVPMGAGGFVAVLAGWIVAEAGRQPFTVYGALRTAASVSPVPGGQVAASLLVYLIVYAIVFVAGALYILRLLSQGPTSSPGVPIGEHRAPGSPLAVAPGDGPAR